MQPLLALDALYQAVGCAACHRGYQGRIGIHALMPMTPSLRALVDNNASLSTLKQQTPTTNLWTSAIKAINAGITSYHEIERILGEPEAPFVTNKQQKNDV